MVIYDMPDQGTQKAFDIKPDQVEKKATNVELPETFYTLLEQALLYPKSEAHTALAQVAAVLLTTVAEYMNNLAVVGSPSFAKFVFGNLHIVYQQDTPKIFRQITIVFLPNGKPEVHYYYQTATDVRSHAYVVPLAARAQLEDA